MAIGDSKIAAVVLKHPLVSLLILALAAHFAFLAVLPERMRENSSSDYTGSYLPVAEQILAGNGVVYTPGGSPATRYPPGFSLIIAGFLATGRTVGIADPLMIRLLIVISALAAAILLYLISARLLTPGAAFLATALWITHPFFLMSNKQPNSEVPFVPLMYGAVLLAVILLQDRRLTIGTGFALGIVCSAASMVRPIAVLMPFLMLAVLLCFDSLWKRPAEWWRFAVSLTVGYGVLILPWMLYVHAATGDWILLSSGGMPSLMDGFVFAVDRGFADPHVPDRVLALMRRIYDQGESFYAGGFPVLIRNLLHETAVDPLAMIELFFLKFVRSWYGTDSMRYESINIVLQVIYLVPAVIGIDKALKQKKGIGRFAWLAVVLVLYNWGMCLMVLSLLRYMFPVMGLLMIFTAIGCGRLLGRETVLNAIDKGLDGRVLKI